MEELAIILSLAALIWCITINGKINAVLKIVKTHNTIEAEKNGKMTSSTQTKTLTEPEKIPSPTMTWLTTNWPIKLGSFLILLSFGWFTTYAFLNNWIGPVGRIAFGVILGLLIVILGEWRMKTSKNQGSILLGLGTAAMLVTIFAGRNVYDFFTPFSALLFMAIPVVFTAFTSIRYKIQSLAIWGLFLAGIVPLLVKNPTPDFVGLFAYLFVICAGTLWIVTITGWRILTPLALGIMTLYSLVWIERLTPEDELKGILFAFLFAILFYSTNIAAIIKNRSANRSDLISAAGNGFLLLIWIAFAVQDEWRSIVTSATMMVFLTSAYILFRITSLRATMYVYGIIGVAMLAAATAFELKGEALTIAYTIEAGAVIAATGFILKDHQPAKGASVLILPTILMAMESLGRYEWRKGIPYDHFFVLLTTAAVLLMLGYYFYRNKNRIAELYFLFGGVFTAGLLWRVLHVHISDGDIATGTTLTLYTLIGLCLTIFGKTKDSKIHRHAGAIVIGVVVARLLFIDIWDMNITEKIITFFLVGALLISTAFIGKSSPQKV